MSATCYKKPHVDILICIEMTRERNLGTKKKTPGITSSFPTVKKGLNLNTLPYGDEHTVFLECGPRQTRMPVDVFVCCINITGILTSFLSPPNPTVEYYLSISLGILKATNSALR